jgi:GT2 family glycosyltransferase
MDLSVIIVTYNNKKEIGACLRSVLSETNGLKTEVFIVDNGSSDRTRQAIEDVLRSSEGDGVKTMWNDKNIGFAAAVNQGLKLSTGDYVLLLNPDAEVIPGAFAKMIAYLKEHPKTGVAGGKIIGADGTVQPSVRCFPALGDQLIILTKLYRFFPKMVAGYFCDGFDYDKEQEVDQVRGAFFFITRKLLQTIGSLDEKNFFVWFEEVDYCFRAKVAGFTVSYVPVPSAIHSGGASFNPQLSLIKQRWLNRSMRNYFRKRGRYWSWIVVSIVSPFSLLLAWLTQIFKIKPKNYA